MKRKPAIEEPEAPRPEPEGLGDWLYLCTGCGYQRLDNATFNRACPKCGGRAWMCRWLKKVGVMPEKPRRQGNIPSNPNIPKGENPPDPIMRRQKVVLPLNRTDNPPTTLKSRVSTIPSGRPGRQETDLPMSDITTWAAQGMGYKAIATKLAELGILVSHMTIKRRLEVKP